MRRGVEAVASFWVSHRLTFPVAVILAAGGGVLSATGGTAVGEFAGMMLSGATFLAAAMVNVLLRVWSWGEANETMVNRLTGHERNERAMRDALRGRFDALERVQTTAAVATTTAVLLILTLIVAAVNPPSDLANGERVIPTLNLWATHFAVALATAMCVFLLSIVAETVHVGATALRYTRTTVGSQSGPHG